MDPPSFSIAHSTLSNATFWLCPRTLDFVLLFVVGLLDDYIFLRCSIFVPLLSAAWVRLKLNCMGDFSQISQHFYLLVLDDRS